MASKTFGPCGMKFLKIFPNLRKKGPVKNWANYLQIFL